MKRCPICHTTFPGDQALFCPKDGSTLTAVAAPTDPLVGTTLEGKYRIESRIGAGGMGAVYKAHHLMLGRDVAVKVLRSEAIADERAAERFRREAQAAARIDHPNAVTIYDFGISADGNAYLVMELLRGTSLREVLDRDGALALDRMVAIFDQVCAGIDRAHQLGIVHRDIKPDNIMVDERPDGSVRVKVVDFGIAMLQDPIAEGAGRLTGTGVVVGTANYMSPEHCRGAHVDSRSDIYALGVVAYEMLTGRVPFAAPLPSAVIVAHVNEPPPPPHLLRPDLPPAVERVVLAALAKNPEERPQTAGELARRLATAARGELATSETTRPVRPVAARPTDPTVRVATDPTRRAAAEPPTPPTAHVAAPAPGARRSLSPVAVGVVAILMAAIGAAIAAAAFGVVNWRTAENANRATPAPAPPANANGTLDPTPENAPRPNANANVAPQPQPAPTPNENAAPAPAPQPAPAPAPPPAPAGSRPLTQAEENEVDAFLADWLASVRARDIGWHVRHYADVVDYYTAGPVPRFRVRADRARAFDRFETIDMRITAVREATISEDGREVRLVVDKQWRFTGPNADSAGKVRQLLVLRRFGGDFRIVAERDLAVY